MAKKMGRPLMGKEKKVYFNISLSKETKELINDAAIRKETSASLLIEQLILERYKDVKWKAGGFDVEIQYERI